MNWLNKRLSEIMKNRRQRCIWAFVLSFVLLINAAGVYATMSHQGIAATKETETTEETVQESTAESIIEETQYSIQPESTLETESTTSDTSLESETEDDFHWLEQTKARLLGAGQGTLVAGPIAIDSVTGGGGDTINLSMGSTATGSDTVNGSTQHETLTGKDIPIYIGSSGITNEGNVRRVYFKPSNPDNFIFSYQPGKVLQFTTNNTTIDVYFKESSTPGIYYAEYVLEAGQTLAFAMNGRYPSPQSAGGTLDVWCDILTREEAAVVGEGVTYGDSYMEGYWKTERNEYTLSKQSQNNVSVIKNGTNTEISQNLVYKVSQDTLNTNGTMFGQDATTAVEYRDILTLPEGITWDAQILSVIRSNSYRINYSSGATTPEKTGYLEFVATIGGREVPIARITRSTLQGGLSGKLVEQGGQAVLVWKETLASESVLASSTYDVLIYKDSLSVGSPASDATETMTITNEVTSTIDYTHTASAVATNQASTTVYPVLKDDSVTLTKTLATSGEYRGEAYTWNLTLTNSGEGACQDLNTLTDVLPKEFLLTGANLVELARDADANVVSIEPVTIRIEKGSSYVTMTYNTRQNLYICISSWNGYRYCDLDADILDDYIRRQFSSIDYDTTYTVSWKLDGSDKINPGDSLVLTLPTTAKDSFEVIPNDVRNSFGSETSTNSAAVERTNIGTLVANSTVTPKTDYDIAKQVNKDGQQVTSSTFLFEGDVIENVVTYNRYGTGGINSSFVINDIISGGQNLLVPVADNTGVSGLAAYNPNKTVVDGVEYYIIETGVNRYYHSVKLGNGLEVDSIEIWDGKTKIRNANIPFTQLDSGDYTGSMSYLTRANKAAQSETNGLIYPLRNRVNMYKETAPTYNIYDETEHYAIGFTSFEKKIVVSGAGTPTEKLDADDFLTLSYGCKMTYRLALTNGTQSELKIAADELVDHLPNTFGVFDWNTTNITLKCLKSDLSEVTAPSYAVAPVSEGMYTLTFPDGITVPADETLYIYVTLAFPDNDGDEKTWTEYLETGNLAEVWNILEIIDPETGTSWEDPVRHKLPPFAFVYNKKVVESGAGTSSEVMEDVDNNKIVVEADKEMTYKLTLNNRSDQSQTWNIADMWDELPRTFGNFQWNNSNVRVFYKLFSGGSITDGPDIGWQVQTDDAATGEYSIRWTDSVTVPANTVFAAYVVLTFPSEDQFSGYWTDVYTYSNSLVYNTFHVFGAEVSTDNPILHKETRTSKDIIVSGSPGTSSEVAGIHSALSDGALVTYRLMLHNVDTSRPMLWDTDSIEDILPDTYGKFEWKLGDNVQLIYKDLSYLDSVTPPTAEIVYDADTGLYKIKWPNGIKVEPKSGVYIYVYLKYPSSTENASWNNGYNEFWKAAQGQTLTNTFNVFEETHEVTHSVPTINYNIDKKIVTSGLGTDAEQLESASAVGPGQAVDYKLTIENTSQMTQQFTDEMVYDILPDTKGTFAWVKNVNVSMTMKLMPSGNPVNTSYAISKNVDTGKDEIHWLSPLYIPRGETLVCYVTLTYPSGTTYESYAVAASGDIVNKFISEDKSAEVSHQPSVPGKAILQKGVIDSQLQGVPSSMSLGIRMEFLTDNSMYYSTNNPITTASGDLKNDMGVYYYVALYNGGTSKLYINDVVDKLPEGFVYRALSESKNLNDISLYSYVNIVSIASGNPAGEFVEIVDPNRAEAPVFVSAKVTASPTTDRSEVTFKVSPSSSSYGANHIKYDAALGSCYLEPGQAIAWGVIASSAGGTEDFATNTVSMEYTDISGYGVMLPENVKISRNNIKYQTSSSSPKRLLFSSENNDGTSSIIKDASGKATLQSQVTVQKGEVIPNVTKTTYDYTAELGAGEGVTYTEYTNGVDRTDRLGFYMQVTNDGTAAMKDYTITETMEAPYRFIGPVYAKFLQPNSTANYISAGGYPIGTLPAHTRPARTDPNEGRLLFKILSYSGDSVVVEEMTERYGDITVVERTLQLGQTYTLESVWRLDNKIGLYSTQDCKYDLCIDKDVGGNYTLSIRLYNQYNVLEPGGGKLIMQYEATSADAETTLYKTYYNNVSVTPNDGQVFADSKVSQGIVSDDKKSVSNYSMFNVTGGGATGSEKIVTQTDNTSNTASSSGAKDVILIPGTDKEFYYTLEVENINTSILTNLVLIDNLPEVDDNTTYAENIKRGSEFNVSLADNPNFNLQIEDEHGAVQSTLSSGVDYVVQYSTKKSFEESDWTHNASMGWSSTKTNATRSFRIDMITPIPAKSTLKVTFNGKISTPTVNPGQVAWNTFGYAYNMSVSGVTQRLQGAPLKVGVRIPSQIQLVKQVLDRSDSPLTLTENATFTYLIHSGAKITTVDYSDQEALATALSTDGRDVTLMQVTVPSGSSVSAPVTLENLKKYTWDADGKTWVAGVDDFVLTDGTSYVMSEINIAKEYEYVSLGGTREPAYAFTYNGEKNATIDAINKLSDFDGYKIQLSKQSSIDNSPLFGAVFALYSPLSTELISDADYDAITVAPKPVKTKIIFGKNYYLTSVKETGIAGDILWEGLRGSIYYVEEIKSPDGYAMDDSSKQIEINFESSELTAYTYSVTVKNTPGTELPKTGGTGWMGYTKAGLILIIMTFTCLILWKKKLWIRRGNVK